MVVIPKLAIPRVNYQHVRSRLRIFADTQQPVLTGARSEEQGPRIAGRGFRAGRPKGPELLL
jgi:hypothetical protein